MATHQEVWRQVCGILVAASQVDHHSGRAARRPASTSTVTYGTSNLGRAPASPTVGDRISSSNILPSLDEIHSYSVRTIKIHQACSFACQNRSAWAVCLTRRPAVVVYFNSVEACSELGMLNKCVLCAPPHARKALVTAATTFAR